MESITEHIKAHFIKYIAAILLFGSGYATGRYYGSAERSNLNVLVSEKETQAEQSTETRNTQTDNFEADAESAITQTEGLDVIEGENVVITLQCPISLEIMEDPVSTPSGHTYDRKNIEEHIRRYRNDPVTKRPLRIDQLTSNYSIKALIQKHKATRTGN